MLTFWGNIEEIDISAYAATLILPSYMSHLQLSPFRFAAQRSANTGEQPLTLTYTGPGRIEQFDLSPLEHAMDLLCHTCPGLHRDRVQLPKQGAIWSWPPASEKKTSNNLPVVITPGDDASAESNANMRLFFRPVVDTLAESIIGDDAEIKTQSFPPEKAYLSVSRSEIFLHIDVVTAYFRTWLAYLGVPDDTNAMSCRATVCGFLAESPYLTIEATITPNQLFQDLLRFAGLSRWFDELGNDIAPDLDADDTTMTDCGLRVPLKNT